MKVINSSNYGRCICQVQLQMSIKTSQNSWSNDSTRLKWSVLKLGKILMATSPYHMDNSDETRDLFSCSSLRTSINWNSKSSYMRAWLTMWDWMFLKTTRTYEWRSTWWVFLKNATRQDFEHRRCLTFLWTRRAKHYVDLHRPTSQKSKIFVKDPKNANILDLDLLSIITQMLQVLGTSSSQKVNCHLKNMWVTLNSPPYSNNGFRWYEGSAYRKDLNTVFFMIRIRFHFSTTHIISNLIKKIFINLECERKKQMFVHPLLQNRTFQDSLFHNSMSRLLYNTEYGLEGS